MNKFDKLSRPQNKERKDIEDGLLERNMELNENPEFFKEATRVANPSIEKLKIIFI